MDEAIENVNMVAEKAGVKVQEGVGPDYDKKLVKLIHQDRAR
jgi:hypothetical protein